MTGRVKFMGQLWVNFTVHRTGAHGYLTTNRVTGPDLSDVIEGYPVIIDPTRNHPNPGIPYPKYVAVLLSVGPPQAAPLW